MSNTFNWDQYGRYLENAYKDEIYYYQKPRTNYFMDKYLIKNQTTVFIPNPRTTYNDIFTSEIKKNFEERIEKDFKKIIQNGRSPKEEKKIEYKRALDY